MKAKKVRNAKSLPRKLLTTGAVQTDLRENHLRTEKHRAKPTGFPVVGVGSSAGGLEACIDLLRALRADAGMAYVFIQHLPAKSKSALPEIFKRETKMPVLQAKQGLEVKSDHIYLIPPGANMGIVHGILQIMPRIEPPGRHRPVDLFFRCLAEDRMDRAIGVILSGGDGDGTEGMKAIKAEGGITFAQKPATAKVDGMPKTAVLAGAADYVLSPAKIAVELNLLGRHPFLSGKLSSSETRPANDEKHLQAIFEILRESKSLDFSNYKLPMVGRRIQRRMILHKIERMKDYVEYLKSHAAEVEALSQDFLINVTNFFRDAEIFEHLKKKIFPRLFKNRPADSPVRVWVPGCSTGEEAYSIAITLLEYLHEHRLNHRVQIFGTDLSESAIERARGGFYTSAIKTDVAPARLAQFFTPLNHGYRVNRTVRDLCIFANQDVTMDPPFSRLDLISCRNLLIYLGAPLQKRVFSIFHYAMTPTGYLMLGNAENVSATPHLFSLVDKKFRVFAKKNGVTDKITPDFGPLRFGLLRANAPITTSVSGAKTLQNLQSDAIRHIVNRYAPASVVVNEEADILQTIGSTGRFLELAPGQPTLNLLKLAREGLMIPLRNLLKKAKKSGGAVGTTGLLLKGPSGFSEVDVDIQPMIGPSQTRCFIVTFIEKAPPTKGGSVSKKNGRPGRALKPESVRVSAALQDELRSTKEYLKSIIHEYEASAEELQAANEEILSSNEELQSTNEELETAKEELQSTNEELTTVNEELHKRNSELSHVNSDLSNLLMSVRLPIIMVGSDLRIRNQTPMAEKIMNVIPSDVGRPITDIRLKIKVQRLEKLIIDTIANVSMTELLVEHRDGKNYILRVCPYRTPDNRIDGAVLILIEPPLKNKKR